MLYGGILRERGCAGPRVHERVMNEVVFLLVVFCLLTHDIFVQ